MPNDESGSEIRFRVPRQTLDKLSFSGHTPRKFSSWIDSLPKANLGEMARLLYSGLQEFNQLRLEPLQRFKLLEIVRPTVYEISDSLKVHYLSDQK
jgi:hypothetical protein